MKKKVSKQTASLIIIGLMLILSLAGAAVHSKLNSKEGEEQPKPTIKHIRADNTPGVITTYIHTINYGDLCSYPLFGNNKADDGRRINCFSKEDIEPWVKPVGAPSLTGRAQEGNISYRYEYAQVKIEFSGIETKQICENPYSEGTICSEKAFAKVERLEILGYTHIAPRRFAY